MGHREGEDDSIKDDSSLQLEQQEDGRIFQEPVEGACSVVKRGIQLVQVEQGPLAGNPGARRRIGSPGESGCERRQRTNG